MDDRERLATLFSYHWHTTSHLLGVAGRLSAADYHAAPDYGHGSVHGLFFHLLQATRSWRAALLTGRQQSGILPEDYPDLAAVRAGLAAEQLAWNDYLSGLSDEAIAGLAELTNWRGEAFVVPRWRILHHIVLHGMQHHSEIARLLTDHGQAPGNLDFIFYR